MERGWSKGGVGVGKRLAEGVKKKWGGGLGKGVEDFVDNFNLGQL